MMQIHKLFFIILLFISIIKAHDLVEVIQINPTIALDIRYATTNNMMNKKVYTQAKCYLCKDAAYALDAVQQELKSKGLGIKIWDGYRPLTAQWELWKILPDPRYVADPRKGGRHTRGTAIDCTLVNLKTGKEVEMPTGFDVCDQTAWRNYDKCSEPAKKNRTLLTQIMEKHGFVGLKTEWWHFDFKRWEEKENLDLSFEELENKN